MILYKTIALQYGRYLEAGQPGDEYDPVGRMVPTEETRAQRQGILYDLAAARIYLLDHRAANYLDSLRMDVQGMPWEDRQEFHIQDYVREIEFPRDLVWVEYDSRKLWEDRIARGLTTMSGERGTSVICRFVQQSRRDRRDQRETRRTRPRARQRAQLEVCRPGTNSGYPVPDILDDAHWVAALHINE